MLSLPVPWDPLRSLARFIPIAGDPNGTFRRLRGPGFHSRRGSRRPRPPHGSATSRYGQHKHNCNSPCNDNPDHFTFYYPIKISKGPIGPLPPRQFLMHLYYYTSLCTTIESPPAQIQHYKIRVLQRDRSNSAGADRHNRLVTSAITPRAGA